MKQFILSFILIISSLAAAKTDLCSQHLAQTHRLDYSSTQSDTQQFIAFVARLVDEQILSVDYLQLLTQEKISNPFDDILVKSSNNVYKDTFQNYLDFAYLDKALVARWAQDYLTAHQKVKKSKSTAEKKTVEGKIPIKFERIKAGTFTIKERDGKVVTITLTHDFEVLNVPVTEQMWAELMNNVPDMENHDRPSDFINSRKQVIQIAPDQPVKKVTWWSAIEYANRYSIRQGLKPVYDLSEMEKDLKFEDGKLIPLFFGDVEKGSRQFADYTYLARRKLLKINASKGNIYEAEGFRLPTEAEQLFLLTNRGRSTGLFFGDLTAKEMPIYARFNAIFTEPRLHQTDVADRAAFNIDGAYLYDLYGSADEWTSDWVERDNNKSMKGGVDPCISTPTNDKMDSVITRGGSFVSSPLQMQSDYRDQRYVNCDSWNGLRLVRTLPK